MFETLLMVLLGALLIWLIGPTWAVSGTHTVGRADLAGAFEETALDEGFFIGDQVFPLAPQSKKKGNFPVLTRESLTQLHDAILRSTDGTYQRTGFVTEDSSYACVDYGMEIALDDAQVAELAADYGLDIDEAAARIVWWQNKFQHEKRVAALAFDPTTNFTAGQGNYTDVTGTNPWTTTTSNILTTIQTAQEAVVALVGQVPMSAAINYTNFNRLLQTDQVRNALGADRDKTVAELVKIVAGVLGLDELLVGKAVYSGTAGMGTFSATKFWSNLYCLVFCNSRESTLTAPRLGSTPVWTRRTGSSLILLEEYRDDEAESDIVRAKSSTDEVVHDVLFGHLLKVAAT